MNKELYNNSKWIVLSCGIKELDELCIFYLKKFSRLPIDYIMIDSDQDFKYELDTRRVKVSTTPLDLQIFSSNGDLPILFENVTVNHVDIKDMQCKNDLNFVKNVKSNFLDQKTRMQTFLSTVELPALAIYGNTFLQCNFDEWWESNEWKSLPEGIFYIEDVSDLNSYGKLDGLTQFDLGVREGIGNPFIILPNYTNILDSLKLFKFF